MERPRVTPDPFALAARRLKSDRPPPAAAEADALTAALASLDEAELEIRRARDRLAEALGSPRRA